MTLVDIPKGKFSEHFGYLPVCPLNVKRELSEKSPSRPVFTCYEQQ